jgi:O-antigen ligase
MDTSFNLKIFSFTWKITIQKEWIRFAVILTTVMASTIIAYWGSTRILILLLALVVGIAGILVLLNQPNLVYILIFLGGIFIPFTGPSNINAAVLLVALLLGLWAFDMLVIKRKIQFVRSKALMPVLVFFVISVIAFGMGQISWFSFARQAPLTAQVGGFAIFVLSLGTLFVTANLIRELRWLKIIFWTFVGLGTIYVTGRFIRFPLIDRFYSLGFSAGSMFWTWFVALTMSQAVFNHQMKREFRIVLFVIVLMTFYVAYFQANDWKSGWVPPLVVAAALIGLRFKRLTVFAIPVGMIIVAFLANKLVATDEYSWGTRLDAWKIVLEISRVSPLFGLGFSNYYWYTPLFPIRGWHVSFNSHSQYVDLIAQVGIAGLLCFLWVFYEVGKLCWNLVEQIDDGFPKAYLFGVIAGIAGTLMAASLVDWVLPFVYNIGFNGFRASILPWIFLGGAISIEQIYKRNLES